MLAIFFTLLKQNMLTSTTPTVEGNPIQKYLGVISSEVIV
jgi:hypothetical protein